MKKTLLGILAGVYIIICAFVTTCLLTFNDYSISEFGDTSFVITSNTVEIKDYESGNLLVVKKDIENLKAGDEVIYYNTYKNRVVLEVDVVEKVEKVTKTESTIFLDNGNNLSSEYIVGSLANTSSIPVLGSILNVLESRVGFLLIIILPILVIFIYQIYALIQEVKPKNRKKKAGKKNAVTESNKE